MKWIVAARAPRVILERSEESGEGVSYRFTDDGPPNPRFFVVPTRRDFSE
jgi:hypothetical protein